MLLPLVSPSAESIHFTAPWAISFWERFVVLFPVLVSRIPMRTTTFFNALLVVCSPPNISPSKKSNVVHACFYFHAIQLCSLQILVDPVEVLLHDLLDAFVVTCAIGIWHYVIGDSTIAIMLTSWDATKMDEDLVSIFRWGSWRRLWNYNSYLAWGWFRL